MKEYFALLLVLVLALGCFAGCTVNVTVEAPQYDVISIERALELCGAEGNVTTERHYIRATVESITNPAFGAMVITDGTHSISVYNTAGYADMEDKPYKGDEVLLHCILQNFNGKKEIKAADLIEFKHVKIEVDESQYTDMSIADARAAAEGAKVKVDGVVAQITYANGKIPSGVILVDDTGSIYVYDGNIAGRAKVGNTVTVLGAKTWWILEDETNNA